MFKLNLDRTFEEVKLKVASGKITDGKNVVLFEPACVFHERKKPFFRARRKIVLFVDGTRKALKFKSVVDTDKKESLSMEDLNPFWTMGESAEFVDKEITKSLMKHKPMTWAQFVIVLIPVLVTLGIVVKLALQFGAL